LKEKSVHLLFQYLQPFRGRLVVLGLLLGGSIVLELLAPQVIRRFLDSAAGGAALNILLPLAALFFALVVAGCVATELARMFRDGESESLFFAFVLFIMFFALALVLMFVFVISFCYRLALTF